MPDREKVINELVKHIESALDIDSDYVDCVRTDLLQTVVGLLKDQEQMYYTLEHDWRMCRELLNEQQERIETLESLRRIEQEGR